MSATCFAFQDHQTSCAPRSISPSFRTRSQNQVIGSENGGTSTDESLWAFLHPTTHRTTNHPASQPASQPTNQPATNQPRTNRPTDRPSFQRYTRSKLRPLRLSARGASHRGKGRVAVTTAAFFVSSFRGDLLLGWFYRETKRKNTFFLGANGLCSSWR